MKKIILGIALGLCISALVLFISGCQSMARSGGGTTTLNLEPNVKLEMITWKDSSLWYLTKPMTESDVAETHMFQQSNDSGLFEGTVVIIESKK